MRMILVLAVVAATAPQLVAAQQVARPIIPVWEPLATRTHPDHVTSPDSSVRSAVINRVELEETARSSRRTATLIGAGVGFLIGGVATWAVLHSGGSTAPCDRDANQDAMSGGECAGITLLGGAGGALLGAVIARWVAP